MAESEVAARSVLGSGDPEYQAEALEEFKARIGEEAFEADPWTGWTAQQGGDPPERDDPALEPTHYLPEQLPDPAVAEASMLAPQDVTNLQTEDAADHPNGPEPGELLTLGVIDELPEKETVETQNTQEELPEGWTVQNPEGVEGEAEVVAEGEAAAEEEGVPPESWSKQEIQDWADERGIAGVDMDNQTKAEMIAAIEAA
jgi:hypothetical protein